MTAREVYEGILIELDKQGAPNLYLDEYNYFINKGVYNYINKRYNVYDVNQQTTDDLQVLKATSKLTGASLKQASAAPGTTLVPALYTVLLPKDYYHLLNCVVTYQLQNDFQCYPKDYQIQFAAKRLSADMYANILNNAFLKPSYKRPYYFIQNNEKQILGDWMNSGIDESAKVRELIQKKAGDTTAHNAYKDADTREGLNTVDSFVGPTMEVNYGKDASIFNLVGIDVHYLKVPSRIVLTPEQVDMTIDNSQIMEFPEYVCRQIIRETVMLIGIRNGDPSAQAVDQLNTSIPVVPGGQQQRPAAQQQQQQ